MAANSATASLSAETTANEIEKVPRRASRRLREAPTAEEETANKIQKRPKKVSSATAESPSACSGGGVKKPCRAARQSKASGVKTIDPSTQIPGYNPDSEEVQALKQKLGCSQDPWKDIPVAGEGEYRPDGIRSTVSIWLANTPWVNKGVTEFLLAADGEMGKLCLKGKCKEKLERLWKQKERAEFCVSVKPTIPDCRPLAVILGNYAKGWGNITIETAWEVHTTGVLKGKPINASMAVIAEIAKDDCKIATPDLVKYTGMTDLVHVMLPYDFDVNKLLNLLRKHEPELYLAMVEISLQLLRLHDAQDCGSTSSCSSTWWKP